MFDIHVSTVRLLIAVSLSNIHVSAVRLLIAVSFSNIHVSTLRLLIAVSLSNIHVSPLTMVVMPKHVATNWEWFTQQWHCAFVGAVTICKSPEMHGMITVKVHTYAKNLSTSNFWEYLYEACVRAQKDWNWMFLWSQRAYWIVNDYYIPTHAQISGANTH